MKVAGFRVVAFCALLAFSVVFVTEAADVNKRAVPTEPDVVKKTITIPIPTDNVDIRILENEKEAWKQLCKAKNSETADGRNQAYADAIQSINKALESDAERASALLLASRIYRGKGGISFAKDFFARAAATYLNEVVQHPESVTANLNAAIILYAGDTRYWESYEQNRKKALRYANILLHLKLA